MIEPQLLARGKFSPENLVVTVNPVSNRATTPDIEQEIEKQWDIFYRESVAAGKNIWNGMTYRVNSLAVANGKLNVEFASMDFKTRESILRVPGYWQMPEEYWRKGACVGAWVKTADDFYVFELLSGTTAAVSRPQDKKIGVIGGVMDEEVPLRSGIDIYETMYKEMEEETAIPRDSISRCMLEVVYMSPSTLIAFHFMIDLLDTKEEVAKRFARVGGDAEVQDLLFVPAADMPQHLAAMGGSMAFLSTLYF